MKRDGLTGLPSRHGVAEYVRDDTRLGVFFDIDGFVWLNDQVGFAEADSALVKVASALRRIALAHGGVAFRIGGDEILVILPPLSPHAAAVQAARSGVAAVRALALEYARADDPSRHHLAVNAVIGPVTRALSSRISEVKSWIADAIAREKEGDVHRCEIVSDAADESPLWKM